MENKKYSFSAFGTNLLIFNAVLWLPFLMFFIFCNAHLAKHFIDSIYFNGITIYCIFGGNILVLLSSLSGSTDRYNNEIEENIKLTNRLETFEKERGAGCYEYLNGQLAACIDDRKHLVDNNDALRSECLRKTEIIDTYKRREGNYTDYYNKVTEILRVYVEKGGEIIPDTTLDHVCYAGFKLEQHLTQNKF